MLHPVNSEAALSLINGVLPIESINVMNDNQTQEKKDTLKNIGADLRLVPSKPYKDDGNYVKVADRLAKELSSSCLLYTSPSPRDGLLSRMPSSA